MKYKLLSRFIAVIVILAACIVMAGWFLDIQVLKSILPGWVTMKFITAVSFFASGILIFLISSKEKNEIIDLLVLVVSFSLLVLMATFLLSLFFGISTGIENLFIKEAAGAVRTAVPGVPAIPTILCFIFISIVGAIFLINPKNFIGFYLLGTLTTLIGGLAVLGYSINIPLMYYSFEGYSAMAFPTAILFILIGVSFILIGKENSK